MQSVTTAITDGWLYILVYISGLHTDLQSWKPEFYCAHMPSIQNVFKPCIYVREASVPAAPPAADPFFMAPLGLGLGSNSCKGTSVRRPFTI